MVPLSDESLLAGIAGRDQDAAAALVRRYQSRVYGLALTVVGDPALAEEVAQEAFLKAWRYADTYDVRRGRVATWLLTITHNAAIDSIRYRREDPVDPDLLLKLIGSGQAAGEDDPDLDTSLQVRNALAALPRSHSEPIVLMVFYGLTAQDVADRTGTPLGTVKTRVRRGFALLRQEWGVRNG